MKLETLTKLANRLSTNSLFSGGGTLHTDEIKSVFKKAYKYTTGKYEITNKGNEVNMDIPVWYVQKNDKDGGYLQLLCVNEISLNTKEQIIYNRIKQIWTGV